MTLDEAKKVAAIAASADGGCASCAGNLFDLLSEAFPQFIWERLDEEPITVEDEFEFPISKDYSPCVSVTLR